MAQLAASKHRPGSPSPRLWRLWHLLAACGSLTSTAQAGAAGWQSSAPASQPRGIGSIARAAAAAAAAIKQSNSTANAAGQRGDAEPDAPAADVPNGASQDVAATRADEEARFSRGMALSKLAVEASEVGSYVYDASSGAGVPESMLRAEDDLRAGAAAAAEEHQRERGAEHALRLYQHARWLAERNHMRAAEWRFREAARLARKCRRAVLAAHSLGRLGYFLVHWRRDGEALEVLRESERINTKSNPLAPFLFGVLDRQAAGPDVGRLLAAEDRILNAKEQPSEELEVERKKLIAEIEYWRVAEEGPSRCLETSELTHALICLSVHLTRVVSWFVSGSN